MDPVRIGRSLRALRIRRGWRQADVATRARLSRGTVSNIERGQLSGVSLDALATVSLVLDADLDVRLRWRGEQLDRMLDAGHARLVSVVAGRLGRRGWDVAVEVTFSIWGERGSFDLLAFHPRSGSLLAVEVKTVVPDFQATIAALDRKARLAPEVAAARGWKPTRSSRLLVIEAGSTARDRIGRIDAAASAALPDRGMTVRIWLADPAGTLAGLLSSGAQLRPTLRSEPRADKESGDHEPAGVQRTAALRTVPQDRSARPERKVVLSCVPHEMGERCTKSERPRGLGEGRGARLGGV